MFDQLRLSESYNMNKQEIMTKYIVEQQQASSSVFLIANKRSHLSPKGSLIQSSTELQYFGEKNCYFLQEDF